MDADKLLDRADQYAIALDSLDIADGAKIVRSLAAEVCELRAKVAIREKQLLCAYMGDLVFDVNEIAYHHTYGNPPRRVPMRGDCTDAEVLAGIDAALSSRGEDA